ncbi:MAG: SUMF1/EgtB/PvdO family nonheme iron enzyme, partial [Phycisphaerales bacterium]|nr:SUMF1/EgtB/PvdO family nonheme iron enzyme [Phycisphaerales bacterium]
SSTQKEASRRPQSFDEVIEHLRRIKNVASGEMPVSGLSATKMLLTPDELETRLNPSQAGGDADTISGVTMPSPSVPPVPAPAAGTVAPPAAPPAPSPFHPPTSAAPPASTPASSPVAPQPAGGGSKTWIYAVAAVLVVVIVGLVGWQLMSPGPKSGGGDKPPEPPPLAASIDTPTGRMVLVQAGPFSFGKDNRPVTLPAFYLDQTEVTNRAYMQFCTARSKPLPPGFRSDKPDFPVTNITYLDAQQFAEWAGKRLPTAQEWEKAARGTGANLYPWGNERDPSKAVVADNPEDKPAGPARVDSYERGASPVGALHLAGNVWEFVNDPLTPSVEAVEHFKALLNPPATITEPWYSI